MTRRSPARDALAAHLGAGGLPVARVSALAGITNPNPAAADAASLEAALRALAGRYGTDALRDRVLYLFPGVLAPVPDIASAWFPLAARTTDPVTSHQAAAAVTGTPTARNHIGRLLLAYLRWERRTNVIRDAQGVKDPHAEAPYDRAMTSEEAAERAIPTLSGAEFAKRCSDLQALGYLRIARDADGHERTRQGRSGRQRLVFELTDTGRTVAQGIEVRAL